MPFLLPSLERTGALMASRSGAVDAVAKRAQILAKSIASKSADSFAFSKSIKVRKTGRGLDRLVVAEDPLAIPKEFGHVVRNRADGPVIGYVRGQHVMAKTYQRLQGDE